MKNIARAGLALAAIAWIAGCAPVTQAGEPAATDTAPLQFRGEVVHLSIEGGFWGIVEENGRRYDVGRLPPEFQQPGLQVRVSARPVQGRVSFRMWGTPVELVHIERTDPR